ncbi:MAG: clan AA aspartic protease [Leptolyngbyaceae bacterium]|nr:clan AA aspartic protease [Leptolyngbyaceae bacterium]
MMRGVVNGRCEATLPIWVENGRGRSHLIEAVIDTGFSGHLTLPSAIIQSLTLSWSATDRVTLGDGSEALFDVYAATIRWHGKRREIDVAESETDPLIGMALLYRYRLQIDAIAGGCVSIQAL